MRHLLVVLLAPASIACVAPPPVVPPQPPAPIPAVHPVAATVDTPPPRAQRPNRCLPLGPPKARAAKKTYPNDTCVDHRRVEAALAQKLAKKVTRTIDGSSVDVSFACDPLTLGVEDVVIEWGYGHGGGLALHRLRPFEGESGFEVLSLVLPGHYSRQPASPLIGRARVDARAFARAFNQAQPALTARVRELEPPPKPNTIAGRSVSVSSSNFHVYFRMSDGLHQLTRHYTGYESSSSQSEYIGLRAALEVVRPLLDSVQTEAREPSADERDFFVESFLTASSRFEDDFAWWVRERYVTMAEHLGTPELVPALVLVVDSGVAEAAREADPTRKKEVLARRLEGPLAALARLTGWDPRKDDSGAPRDLEVVAREVIDECRRVDASGEPR